MLILTALQWLLAFVIGCVALYVVVRLVSAAYFRSRSEFRPPNHQE